MTGTWTAVVADRDGFVLDEETVRAWAKAVNDGATGWAIPCEPPVSIEIVTGSAAPKPQTDDPKETILRLPGSWQTDDKFVEITVDYMEPDDVLVTWKRAQAAAAGLNTAATR